MTQCFGVDRERAAGINRVLSTITAQCPGLSDCWTLHIERSTACAGCASITKHCEVVDTLGCAERAPAPASSTTPLVPLTSAVNHALSSQYLDGSPRAGSCSTCGTLGVVVSSRIVRAGNVIFIRRVLSDRDIVGDEGVSPGTPSNVRLTDFFSSVASQLAERVYELRAVINHVPGNFEAACFGRTTDDGRAAWHTYRNDGRRSRNQTTSDDVVVLVYEAVTQRAPAHPLMEKIGVRDRK